MEFIPTSQRKSVRCSEITLPGLPARTCGCISTTSLRLPARSCRRKRHKISCYWERPPVRNTKHSQNQVALRWDKDRNRALRKRAIAEEISDQQQTASMLRRDAPTHFTKAELRVVGEDAVRKHVPDPKGEWVIACECGHQAIVRIAFSVALERALKCTELRSQTMAHRGTSEATMGINRSTTSPTEGN